MLFLFTNCGTDIHGGSVFPVLRTLRIVSDSPDFFQREYIDLILRPVHYFLVFDQLIDVKKRYAYIVDIRYRCLLQAFIKCVAFKTLHINQYIETQAIVKMELSPTWYELHMIDHRIVSHIAL